MSTYTCRRGHYFSRLCTLAPVCGWVSVCVPVHACACLCVSVPVSVPVCVCKRVCTYCVCMYIWYMTCENFISSRPAQYPPKVVHLISHPGPPPAHRLIRLRGMVMPKKAKIIEVSKLYTLARYYSEVRSCMPSCQDHCFMCWQRRHLHNNIIANMTWDREKGVRKMGNGSRNFRNRVYKSWNIGFRNSELRNRVL